MGFRVHTTNSKKKYYVPFVTYEKKKEAWYFRSINFERVFDVFDFLQKTNKGIQLYYYDTSNRHVFVRFLEETEDTKKPFRNYLTFNAQVLKKI